MKKAILTLAIVLGLGLCSFAGPNGGGMFQRGAETETGAFGDRSIGSFPTLPGHGYSTNQPAAPLGSGIAVLAALGAAYLVGKRRNED